MDLEQFGIRKYMVKANEQIKCINIVFAMSFLLKLLMRKIVSDNIMHKKNTYYLQVSLSTQSILKV